MATRQAVIINHEIGNITIPDQEREVYLPKPYALTHYVRREEEHHTLGIRFLDDSKAEPLDESERNRRESNILKTLGGTPGVIVEMPKPDTEDVRREVILRFDRAEYKLLDVTN